VAGLSQSIRSVLAGIDVAVPLRDLKTGEEQIDSDIIQDRLVATLANLFGGLALLLAAIGLYGVLAYLAARRTREIGIRLALGAGRRSVLWLVAREAVVMVGVGAAIGLGAAIGAARLVRSLLFGLDAHDPMTAAVATLVLLAAAALAVLVPALRAMAIEPSQALRDE
jgi:ABC-type antimicrobial peptide transport system permease subunit